MEYTVTSVPIESGNLGGTVPINSGPQGPFYRSFIIFLLHMEKLVSLCKRRGFIFPSSEIYGGFAAVYDYGPYGVELKNNIQKLWWKHVVQNREDVVGLDSAIFMHPKTWEASGHVDSFDDPQIDCRTCKHRMRADHVLEKFGVDADRWPITEVNMALEELKQSGKLKCEQCGNNDLTEAKQFNLLVKTNLGSPTEQMTEENVVYARGETCQGIYLNFKNILDSMRVKVPFGIAQVGKAFRNEIVARQFIFRTREFEQMEMQYFVHPESSAKHFDAWKEARMDWYIDVLQFSPERVRFKPHEKLAHYAKAAEDIEYNFESLGGFKEIEGLHDRGDWDLSRHSEYSGKKLEYLDQANSERYIPHIVETSAGLNRVLLAVLDNAYTEETIDGGETRIVLKLPAHLAPVHAAVFPLQKDAELQRVSREIFDDLKDQFVLEYDESGSIGKRYRRQDEIGTPFCVTVDYESLDDEDVTVRNRDTMEQERVKVADLAEYLKEKMQS